MEDTWSANSRPWIFCVPDRWCNNKVVVSPAYLERESVTWCYGEKYIKRESVERYCERYGENKRIIEIFKVNRKYRELVERLSLIHI